MSAECVGSIYARGLGPRGLASVRRADGWLYPREQGGPPGAGPHRRRRAAPRGSCRTLITGWLLGGPGARAGPLSASLYRGTSTRAVRGSAGTSPVRPSRAAAALGRLETRGSQGCLPCPAPCVFRFSRGAGMWASCPAPWPGGHGCSADAGQSAPSVNMPKLSHPARSPVPG